LFFDDGNSRGEGQGGVGGGGFPGAERVGAEERMAFLRRVVA
jgi:hypothetical protein